MGLIERELQKASYMGDIWNNTWKTSKNSIKSDETFSVKINWPGYVRQNPDGSVTLFRCKEDAEKGDVEGLDLPKENINGLQ